MDVRTCSPSWFCLIHVIALIVMILNESDWIDCGWLEIIECLECKPTVILEPNLNVPQFTSYHAGILCILHPACRLHSLPGNYYNLGNLRAGYNLAFCWREVYWQFLHDLFNVQVFQVCPVGWQLFWVYFDFVMRKSKISASGFLWLVAIASWTPPNFIWNCQATFLKALDVYIGKQLVILIYSH